MMTPSIPLPGLLATFIAGLLTFASPCVLPLIPVYLSFISGESAETLKNGKASRFALLMSTLLFVAGFSLVFVALAVVFGGGMRFIGSSAPLIINRVAGILIIILAANTLFDFIPFLRFTLRMDTKKDSSVNTDSSTVNPFRPILFGMAFAAGWTPCIGPILSSILLYAGSAGMVDQAIGLLALYAAGLGLPFILTALFFERFQPLLGWLKRHMTAVRILSALLLAGFGVLMLTGGLEGITRFFLQTGYSLIEYSQETSGWFGTVAGFIGKWLTFQGI